MIKKTFLILSIILFGISGCVQNSSVNTGAIIGAGVGAISGAIIAKNKDKPKGAIIGAIAGALIGGAISYYQVNKVKSAQEINNEFIRETGQKINSATKAIAYEVYCPKIVEKGTVINAKSSVKIVTNSNLNMVEDIYLLNSSGVSEGHIIKPLINTYKSGEWEAITKINTANLKRKGTYTVEKTLLVNNRPYQKKIQRIQIL